MPQLLNLTWWERLFTQNYQSIQSSAITRHTLKLLSLCQRKSPLKYQEFESIAFWDNLKKQSHQPEEIKKLHEHWNKLAPLVHLNSRQLIQLLQNEINPLIKAYNRVLVEIEEESEYSEYFPGFLNDTKNKVIFQVKTNLKNIERLKQCLYYSLAARSGAYKILKTKRQVDDIESAIAAEIKLKVQSPHSEGMDDNQRMATYDILRKLDPKHSGIEIKNLHHITKPIPRRSINALKTQIEFKIDQERLQEFIEKHRRKNHEKQWANWVKKWPTSFGYYLHFFWRWRHVVGAAIIFWLAQPILSLLLPLSLYQYANLGLFSISFGYSFWKVFKERILHWKSQELEEALVVLENSQVWINCHLSQTPLDIPHFDVGYFIENVQAMKSTLDLTQAGLKNRSLLQKWFLPNRDFDSSFKIEKKLQDQKTKIKEWMSQIALHIAKRIGTEIEDPYLGLNVLSKWREFVKIYGSSSTKELFENNANIMLRWEGKLIKLSSPYDPSHFPFGKKIIREDQDEKWKKLIQKWAMTDTIRAAGLKLHGLIMGREMIKPSELENLCRTLSLESSQMMKLKLSIQNFIYDTLRCRSPKAAALLLPVHQDKIRQYRIENRDKIEKAKAMMDEILEKNLVDDYSDSALHEAYRLLDIEEYYDAIQGDVNINSFSHNKVRAFFERYKGASNNVFHLLRFVPEFQQAKYAIDIAKKREAYLNKQGGIPTVLSDNDVIIFNNDWVDAKIFSFIRKEEISKEPLNEEKSYKRSVKIK